jgi:hypothetical protein
VCVVIYAVLSLKDGQDAANILNHLNDTENNNSNAEACCNFKQILVAFPWDKLRIPIVAFQIVTQYIGITGLPLPDIYSRFLAWADVFNFNLGWLLSLSCLTNLDFYERLLLTTLSPIAGIGVLGLIYMIVNHNLGDVSERAVTSKTAKLASFRDTLYLVLLTMIFLIYSSVSTTVFQTFACEIVDDSDTTKTNYLRADYSIQCGTAEYKVYRGYAILMVSVYPIGIPLFSVDYYTLLKTSTTILKALHYSI